MKRCIMCIAVSVHLYMVCLKALNRSSDTKDKILKENFIYY
jgi:hypothetical protein